MELRLAKPTVERDAFRSKLPASSMFSKKPEREFAGQQTSIGEYIPSLHMHILTFPPCFQQMRSSATSRTMRTRSFSPSLPKTPMMRGRRESRSCWITDLMGLKGCSGVRWDRCRARRCFHSTTPSSQIETSPDCSTSGGAPSDSIPPRQASLAWDSTHATISQKRPCLLVGST